MNVSLLFYMAELQCTNAFVLKSTERQTDGQTWSKHYIPHNFVHDVQYQSSR